MAESNLINFPAQTHHSGAKKQAQLRFNFTMQRLKQLDVTGKTYYVYDNGQAGLCMRVSAGGSKALVYYRKVNGRPERVTLGKLGALSLTDARNACKKFEGQRAAGGDPAADRRAARLKGATVDDLMKSWVIAAKAKKLRRWADEQRLYDLHIKPTLGNKEAAAIVNSDIERIMNKLGKRHRTANKAHDLLRRVYKHAIKKGTHTNNPCQGVTRFAETVRERVLSNVEVQSFLKAVEGEEEPWRSYFKLLLLTGARRSAVASMRWQDLDTDTGIWTIPGWASKNKKSLTIALVPQAVEVIEAVEKIDSVWVFPANSKTGHIVEPAKAWNRIKKAAGLSDVRIHDVRRTLGTTLAVNGASSHVIAKALGHKSLQSAAAYVHMDAEVARAALEGVTEGWLK